MLIERRALLRGLFAAPAIVLVDSLMPLRGRALIVRIEARTPCGDEYWNHTGPIGRAWRVWEKMGELGYSHRTMCRADGQHQ